jgi:hypothetical protein
MYTFLTRNFEPVAHILSSGPTIINYIVPTILHITMHSKNDDEIDDIDESFDFSTFTL